MKCAAEFLVGVRRPTFEPLSWWVRHTSIPRRAQTAADVKSFGCRPARVIDRDGGRRPKAPEERTRGTAVSGWPMGIWRGSGFGEGWFSQDPREVKAADDCGLAAAGVLDGVIEDQSEMPCRRLQVAA